MKIKNYFLSIVLMSLGYSGFSQTLFSENFNGTSPFANWTLINADGRTPAANVGFVNAAWVTVADSSASDLAAVSTSWYTPAGAADDYMISPSIILGAGNYLQFDALAIDSSYRDGYELRVSTTTPTVAGLMANPPLLTVAAENSAWNRRTVDLSAYNNDTIYLAWRNNSNDMYLLLVDNIRIYTPVNNDAAMRSVSMNSLYTNASNAVISGEIENDGLNAITSLKVNWSADGGTTVNTDVLTLNLPSFTKQSFTHTMNWTATNPGVYTDILVWVSDPNSVTDAVANNDTVVKSVFVNNGTSGNKRVLVEEFTTAPCQFCPDGAVIVENILATIPEAVAVGIHAGFGTDAMTIPAHSAYAAAFASGAPTASIDRKLFDGEADVAIGRGGNGWVNAVNAQKVLPTPCNVSISGLVTGNTANVNVDVNFVDYPVDAQNLRVTLFVVEDSVTGTGSGYNQVNFYNNTAGHPYFGKGNPIVGFVHKHVVRSVPTGTWGDAAYFATNPTLNSSHTKSYAVTLNPAWKQKDISIVAFVNYYNANGGLDEYEILNVQETKISTLVGAKENVASVVDFSVYPNPANDFTNVTLNLKKSANVEATILDMTGKQVSFKNYGSVNVGTQILEVNTSDLSDGLYFVNLKIGDEIKTTKIAVMK